MWKEPEFSWSSPEDIARGVGRGVSDSVFGGIRSCVGSIILVFVVGSFAVCGIGGMGYYLMSGAGSGTPATLGPFVEDGPSWDGKSPFTCEGHERIELRDVKARLSGKTAVTAKGHCKLTLVDADIRASVAIRVEGNAQVVLKGGRIRGKKHALSAASNGRITVEGTKVKGKTHRTGNGKVKGLK